LQDFYDFRRFQKHYRAHPPRKSAAPALVPLLWRAGFLFLLALGALTVYAAFRPDPGLQWLTAWIGLGVGLLGPLVLRIACELAMTVLDFRDYLRLRDGEWT
jgi:hypothetical protein